MLNYFTIVIFCAAIAFSLIIIVGLIYFLFSIPKDLGRIADALEEINNRKRGSN